MDITRAVETVEYRIATESDTFQSGNAIKMDIHKGWPPATELADALRRKYPYLTVTYQELPNDCVQLIVRDTRATR